MSARAERTAHGSRVRLQIKWIEVKFPIPPRRSINLKLLHGSKNPYNLELRKHDQKLRWENIHPINANMDDSIEIRVYELQWQWVVQKRQRVGSINFKAHQVTNMESSYSAFHESGRLLFSITVLCAPSQGDQAAKTALKEAAQAMATSRRETKHSRSVDLVRKIGMAITELSPVVDAAVNLCIQAWEVMSEHGRSDEVILPLVDTMGYVLEQVAAIEDYAKIAKVQDIIAKLLQLVEDASRFVIQYKSNRSNLRTVASLSVQDQVDNFLRKFDELTKAFDRGIAAQMVHLLLNEGDRTLLDRLVVSSADFDPSRCCLEGTRLQILHDVEKWACNADDSRSFFWLYGPAGCGKSSIASSIVGRLENIGSLAGCFFCKRDNEHLRTPENVISHLAASLAFKCQPYGVRLVEALRQDPRLLRSATKTRFTGLIANPVRAVAHGATPRPIVVVVDAVDENGTADTRKDLISCLLEMSQLVTWLKVIVTSRPNDEIYYTLQSSHKVTVQRNLFAEDPSSVSKDILAFVRSRMNAIPADLMGRDDSPDEADIGQLVARSNNLFIWARTACNLIEQSFDPGAVLQQILAGERSMDAKQALGEIYATALRESLGDTKDGSATVRLCVGAVILTGTRRPLPDAALATILSKRIQLHTLSRVISRLGSVLYRDDHGAVRVLHQSFSDYMTEGNCPEQYRIDLAVQNLELAASCLELMLGSLRFNICGLEDSRIMNRDVPDLPDRIEQNIHPELAYSCVYWTTHLVTSTLKDAPSSFTQLLDKFLSRPVLLFWIEVLSLLKEMHAVTFGMDQLINWVNEPQNLYTRRAVDVYRFVSAAYVPISASTPHLYVSALAFGAVNYDTFWRIGQRFPGTMSVAVGTNLWNIQCLHTIKHAGSVLSVAFSPDGQRVASGSHDRVVRIWDAQTGVELLKPLQGHSDWVTCVAFSPDSQRVISGSWDKTVRIWDAQSGEPLLQPLVGHAGRVTSVMFSLDCRRALSGSDDETVRIWDTHTGAVILKSLRGRSNRGTFAFSPDGRLFASGTLTFGVQVCNARTGTVVPPSLQGHSDSVTCIAFSPDSNRVVTGSLDKTVRIWNVRQGATVVEPMHGHSGGVTSVVFSPDSRRVASGSDDKTVRIWDAQTGALLLQPLCGHSKKITSVAFSPDSRRVASSSEDHTVRIWDAQTDTALLKPPRGNSSAVLSVAFSPNSQNIVSSAEDAKVQIWDTQTGSALLEPLRGHLGRVAAVSYSADGQYIVSGSNDKTIRIWDAQTGALIQGPLQGHLDSVTSVAFSPDCQRIASGSLDKSIRIWDTRTGAPISNPLRHPQEVNCVAFSPSGGHIASGSDDATVRIWCPRTGRVVFALHGHTDPVMSIGFSSDGRRILSGSDDRTIRIWNTNGGTEAIPVPIQGHSDSVTSVAFSPGGQHIVSGSYDRTIRIWDAQTGAALFKPLLGHSDWVTCVAFSPDGRHIVSGSQDNTVRIWNALYSPESLEPYDPSSTEGRRRSYVTSGDLQHALDSEGWVCGPSGERLFWIPPAYQRTQVDHSICVISTRLEEYPVAFDLSRLSIGREWTSVRHPSKA